MLKFKKGDLVSAFIDNEVNVFGHQANCMKVMGAGIALQVKKRMPELYVADQMTLKSVCKLGTFSYHIYSRGIAFNLYGQGGFGRGKCYTDYNAIRMSLRGLANKLRNKQATARIGLTKLGCGLAGGDWATVQQIIEEELQCFDVTIYSI